MSKHVESHVINQYSLIRQMGNGAYGIVWQVQQKKTKKRYALKKVFDAFRNNIDAQRTYRQVEILKQLNHQNIIKLLRVIKSRNKKDLYLIFQFMEADLHSVVGSDILQKMHQIYVFYQILKALKYLHSAQLIHRDLKPSNILLNSECKVKICDFGLIRTLNSQNNEEAILSQQVATKWYRAPQLLLGSRSYKKPIDIWSFGCIVAQILTGKPIFAGDSTLNQLQKIMQFTGQVSKQDIDSLDSPVAQQLITQIKVKKRSFRQYFSSVDPDYWELLKGTLQFNPHKRMSIDEILSLQLFEQFKDQTKNLKMCDKPIKLKIDDNMRYNLKVYRQKIYEDIDKKNKSDSIIQGKKSSQTYQIVSNPKKKYLVQKQKQKRRVVSQDKISQKPSESKNKFRQYSISSGNKSKQKFANENSKYMKVPKAQLQPQKIYRYYKNDGYKSAKLLNIHPEKFSPYKSYLQSMIKIQNYNSSSHNTLIVNNFYKKKEKSSSKSSFHRNSTNSPRKRGKQQQKVEADYKNFNKERNKLRQLQKQSKKMVKKVSSAVSPKFFNDKKLIKKIGLNNQQTKN